MCRCLTTVSQLRSPQASGRNPLHSRIAENHLLKLRIMETEYGQNRKCFHNVRFSPEEERIIRERMKQYNYTRVSDFIRDAVLDKKLTQRQVVEIEPYKIDNNRLIPQVIDAIRTYDFRLARAITAFEEALNIPYVDPELIHMHARRLRLIGATLGGKIEWLIRFMEGKRPEVMR